MSGTSLFNNIYWSLIQVWGPRFTTIVVFIILARTLSPDEIGTVTYVLGWLAIFLALADQGIAEYFVYNHEAGRNQQLAVWWLQIGLAIVMAAGLSIAVGFEWIPMEATQRDVMLALVWTLPFSAAVSVPLALLRRDSRFRDIAIRSLASVFFGGVLSSALALSGAGVWSLVAKQWIEVVIDVCLLIYLSRWRISLDFAFMDAFRVMHRSWSLIWGNWTSVIMHKVDVLLIGAWIGTAELGYYTMGQRLFFILRDGFAGALSSVFGPRYGRLRNDPQMLKEFFLSSVQVATLAIAPVFLLATLFAGDLIVLLFGSKWEQSAALLSLMCLPGLLIGASFPNTYLVAASLRNKLFSTLMTVVSVLRVAVIVAAVPFGIKAVAAGGIFTILIILPFGIWMVMRILPIKVSEYLSSMASAAILTGTIAAGFLVARYYFGLEHVIALIAVTLVSMLAGMAILRMTSHWGDILQLKHFLLHSRHHPQQHDAQPETT